MADAKVRSSSRPVPDDQDEHNLQKLQGAVGYAERALSTAREDSERIQGKARKFYELAEEAELHERNADAAVQAAEETLREAKRALEEARDGMD